MGTGFQLGYFEALDLAGVGSMGSVWRGRHVVQDVQVAIKVLNREMADNPRAVQGFEAEVCAVARLSHPGIIRLFDYGYIDAELEAASGGEMVAGSPFQIMEFASGGSLETAKFATWSEVRDTLTSLLDALAHAHASDLIHRDLKPANVVICTGEDDRPGLKLTDWGIARVLEDRDDGVAVEYVSGTPRFMAPEQFTGRWRDAGPWTDLYALGCMAFQLLAGRPVFSGWNFDKLAKEHLSGDVPRLRPVIDCPEGVEEWIRVLLRKDPRARFQRAADAACALQALAAESHTSALDGASDLGGFDDEPTMIDLRPSAVDLVIPTTTDGPPATAPMAASWHLAAAVAPGQILMGAGLGLFGLRSVPLVGREHERDVLWRALASVHGEGRPRFVLLQGPSGVGKARLARWTAARAEELGAAQTLTATHSVTGGPADGVPAMLARSLRCGGLSVEQARRRVREQVQAWGVTDDLALRAMAELVIPEQSRARVQRAEERYALIEQMLSAMSRHRPVIVQLRNLQWGWNTVRLLRHVMTCHSLGCRVLFVGMVDTGAFEGYASSTSRPCPEVEMELIHVLGAGAGEIVVLGPLAPEAQRALVEDQLGLAPSLARRVLEVTSGNPRFTVRMVAGWVQSGDLVPTAAGFDLAPSAHESFPAEVAQLWEIEIERALRRYGAREWAALEVAALLGESVTHEEWGEIADVTASDADGLLRTLLSLDLARATDDGWSFRHRAVVEILQQRMEGGPRDRHRQAAQVLSRLYAARGAHAERLGWQLYLAGDPEQAVEALLSAVTYRADRSEDALARHWIDVCRAALGTISESGVSELRARLWLEEARFHLYRGQSDRCRGLLERVTHHARAENWFGTLGRGLVMRGRLHIRSSEFVEAKDSFAQAKAAFTALNDEAGILSAVLGTADSVWRMGDWATARRLYERGLSLAARLGDGGQMSVALIGLGDVHTTEGRPEEAREALDTALRYAEENGLRARVANIHNNIGELEKDRNNFEAAEAAYRRASAMYTALHSPDLWIAQINLALVFLRRRDFAAARDLVERVEPTVAPDLVRMTSAIHSSLAACAAARGDLARYDRRMKAAIQALEEHGGAHLDDAWPIAMAGELVAEWDPERATIALEYACGLWERLGRSQEVAKLQRVIDALADE